MALSSGLRHSAREAGAWVFCALCVIGGLVFRDELKSAAVPAFGPPLSGDAAAPAALRSPVKPSQTAGAVEIRATRNGHFFATAYLNGRPVDVMVDTGASLVALSYEDAERAGVFVRPSDFTHRVATANGSAKVAPVVLDSVSIGDITVRDVRAAVSEPGRLTTSLLGMTFLGRLGRAEMRSGVLMLQE